MNELIVCVTNKEKGTTGLALNGYLEVENGQCPGEVPPLLCCPGIQYEAYTGKKLGQIGNHHVGWWQGPVTNGAEAGTTGEARRLEQIKIGLIGCRHPGMTINYRVRMAPVPTGQAVYVPAGDSAPEWTDLGNADERMEQIMIETVNWPLSCHLCYQVHTKNDGWNTPVVTAGNWAGTTGQNRRIEAIRIWIC